MGDGLKGYAKSRETPSTAFPSALRRVTRFSKDVRLLRQDLPFLNPRWLGLIPRFPSMGRAIPLTTICSRTLPGPEVRLTGLQFPSCSLRPFLGLTAAPPVVRGLPDWPGMMIIKDGRVA